MLEPEILQRLRAGTAGDGMSVIIADKVNHSSYYEPVLTLLRFSALIAVEKIFWGVQVIKNLSSKCRHPDNKTV